LTLPWQGEEQAEGRFAKANLNMLVNTVFSRTPATEQIIERNDFAPEAFF